MGSTMGVLNCVPPVAQSTAVSLCAVSLLEDTRVASTIVRSFPFETSQQAPLVLKLDFKHLYHPSSKDAFHPFRSAHFLDFDGNKIMENYAATMVINNKFNWLIKHNERAQ